MTTATNTASCSITDNGTIVAQESGKELGMYSKVTVNYTVK